MELGPRNWLLYAEEVEERGGMGSAETQETWSWVGPAEKQGTNQRGRETPPPILHNSMQRPTAAHPQVRECRWGSIPSTSTLTGTDDIASSHTWSDFKLGSDSRTLVGSVLTTGSFIAIGSGSASSLGSGISSVHSGGGGWLGSGFGVEQVMSSSTRVTVI